ncbi:MAG: AbrB/MazE/SpoVT family DNA-binding domain-containing protein [Proteobacteria bacterium]|nr:AbrB/MazE/SpoVT family DNA-binding domain-containing protein [Pseudomonadota bacterium]
MRVQLSKWGNSLGLRVPRDVAAQTGLTEGSAVDIEARDDGSIIIRKAKRRYTLEELVAGMTPDKAHPSLIDDEPMGCEFPNEES